MKIEAAMMAAAVKLAKLDEDIIIYVAERRLSIGRHDYAHFAV
jgi:hypothetical protein